MSRDYYRRLRGSDTPWVPILLPLAALVLLLVSAPAWSWYRAGVQQRVYQRQGIQISRWEVFIGIKPAESVVQVKERGE